MRSSHQVLIHVDIHHLLRKQDRHLQVSHDKNFTTGRNQFLIFFRKFNSDRNTFARTKESIFLNKLLFLIILLKSTE
ncbi:hypothetical protein CW304_03630 [Bacillus sp. UFRGS-B20]|nr:hypothetical protein CW304_03630 [Bacillus sp. UFRGS-B20]